uniref:Uncharacterized protein n=1 Tax=Anguilla anguilla TaxID=7936 RepID=A0A0E9V556_ANGAN
MTRTPARPRREAGEALQTQGEHAALSGRGGGPAPQPAEGVLRQELPRLQAQDHGEEARV